MAYVSPWGCGLIDAHSSPGQGRAELDLTFLLIKQAAIALDQHFPDVSHFPTTLWSFALSCPSLQLL